MYYVYVLRSDKDKRCYVGYSANLRQRAQEHTDGKAVYTRNFRPWKLVYYEAYQTENLARMREEKLKHHDKRYTELLKRILNEN